jgi:WD40 repeat protein
LRNGELIAYSVQDVPKLIWRVASLESSRSFSSLAATTGKVAHSADDRTLVLYDLSTGERLATKGLDDLHITQLQFSTDGKELAVLDRQGTLHLLSAENLKTLGPGKKCPEPGEIVLISPSLTACFSGGFQPVNAVTQFSPTPETKKLDNLRDTLRAARFSRDSKQIALGFMGGKFAIWDVGRHNMSQRKFMPHSADVTAIGWADNVNQIAIGDQNGTISIQNTNKILRIVGRSKFTQDGKSVVKVGKRIIPISTYENQVDELKDRIEFEKLTSRAPSAFSGTRNVFAAVDGDRLSIWATKDGQRIAALEVPKLRSPGGSLAQLAADATGLRYALIVNALTFRVVDCTSSQDCGSPLSEDRELKIDSYIASIAVSADGNLLAVGSGIYNGAIYLWRWADTKPFAALRGGHDVLDVRSLVFHPTAPILVSSGNRRIVFWDLLGQREIGSIDNLKSDTFRLSFSVDGSVLIAELSDQQAIVVEFDPMNWIKLACKVAGRRLDEQEMTQFGILPRELSCPAPQ